MHANPSRGIVPGSASPLKWRSSHTSSAAEVRMITQMLSTEANCLFTSVIEFKSHLVLRRAVFFLVFFVVRFKGP